MTVEYLLITIISWSILNQILFNIDIRLILQTETYAV